MNPRELKAVRLVTDGRVRIQYDSPDCLAGMVWGDHGLYQTVSNPEGDHCDCAAYGKCSHIIALKLQARYLREQHGRTIGKQRSRRTRRVETRNNMGIHLEGDAPRTRPGNRPSETVAARYDYPVGV